MAEKICSVCGTTLPENAKFCFNCGSRVDATLEIETANVLVCDVCGYENEPGSKFCISCGAKLSDIVIAKSETKTAEQLEKVEKVEKKVKKESAPKKRKSKIQFYQLFYIGVAVAFIGLIAYGVIKRNERPAEIPHQDVQTNMEIMKEIDRLREAVDKNPNDLQSTLQLANLLHDAHLFEQAIIYYRRYLEKNEKDPNARVDLGICLFETGKVNEAIAEMEKALSYAPNHQLALYNLGIVYLANGNPEKSNEYFRKCIEVNPNADVSQKAKRILEQHKF